MPFPKRFLLRVLLPGGVVSLPLAVLFLSQVLQLDVRAWLILIAAIAVLYGLGAAFFWRALTPQLEEIERAIAADHWVSEALSAGFNKTMGLTVFFWVTGGLLFSIVTTVFVFPTFLGFSYFLVAVLISAAPSVAWAYIAAKQMLVAEAARATSFRYTGRLFPVSRKIATVFILFFIASIGALVQLVSSKVSTTLERVAIQSASARFEQFKSAAATSPRLDQAGLDQLAKGLPPGFVLHRIPKSGPVISSGLAEGEARDLTTQEIDLVRRYRTGDSTRFVGEHVTKFAELRDGSIIAMTVPWDQYRDIPYQIAFFTILVALLTTALFAAATYFLSKDITGPIRELMRSSASMASGDFATQPRLFSDDEVGELGRTFAETRDNLRGLIARVGGSGSTITDGVRVITGGSETLLTLSAKQSDVSRSSSDAVGNVRKGAESVLDAAETVSHLTQDVSSRALELQASAEEVARSMDHLFQSVDKTSSSVTEMDASARSMSDRTDLLSNIAEEVLTFVTEMDSTIDELRRNAMVTADLSGKVREDAARGSEAVSATVEGIGDARATTERTSATLDELQQSIAQITQILTVIEEITERTNLLSLNAAIIAAQAGEQGASFTVVASEIRQLADRTRGSTKEISGIIKAVQSRSREASQAMREGVSRVNQNVSLARNASESLTKILDSAGRSYDMANRIAAALEQQSQASRHLHQVTSRMSDNIIEINKATSEQARGTQMLAAEAERVREIALQVKTATEQQSIAGTGIAHAMEQISTDVMRIRDLLETQLKETESISNATTTLLQIAQENDTIARNFTQSMETIVQSGQNFEQEVNRFKLA